MRRLPPILALGAFLTATVFAAEPANTIQVEAFSPADLKPQFAATSHGQGLTANASSYAQLPGPGFIRRDQGTVELLVKLQRDLKPYSAYRTLFALPPDASQSFNNQFSIIFVPDDSKLDFAQGYLIFTMKKGTNTYRTTARGLDWKAGSEHSIIATWGPQGMRLYIDGALAGEENYTGGFHNEAPSSISIGKHVAGGLPADMIIDELKISDTQRDAAYAAAAAKATTAPQLDDHTLALMHFDGNLSAEGTNTAWRSALSPILVINPRDFGIDSTANNVYAPGDDISVDAMLFNSRAGNTAPVTLTATAKTFKGQEAATAKTVVKPNGKIGWQHFTVPLPALKGRIGWYSVTVDLMENDKAVSSFTTPCLVIPPPAKSKYEFGLDYYGTTSVPWVTMKRLGMRWIRPHNNHWNWAFMEQYQGEFDFHMTDSDVAGATANGVEIMAVLGLTPEWAGVRPDNYEDFKGGKNQWKVDSWKYNWRPRNLEEYRNYVTRIVERYKGKVKYWEHYNEPDWHLPQTIGFAYGGTTEQFVEQMKVNAEVIRKIDPQAKILFPGIACTPVADPNFVRDVIKLGGMKYVDIVGMHSYGGNAFFAKQIELFRQAGYKGEIWQTEKLTSDNNMASGGFHGMYRLQIPDIVETMAMDVPVYIAHPEYDYFKRRVPQIESFVVPFFYRMVGERTYAGRIPGVNIHTFDGPGGPLVVTWEKKPVKLNVGQEQVTVTDMFGESAVVNAPKGVLPLSGSDEVRYITSAPGKTLVLNQIGTPQAGFQPLSNADFEEVDGDAGLGAILPKLWVPSPYHNTGRFAADNTEVHSGKYSVRVESPKTDKQTIFQDIGFVPGRTYEISGWIRTETARGNSGSGSKASITVWCRSLSKELVSLNENNANTSSFRRYSAQFTVPEGATDTTVSLSVPAGTDKAWFDDIEITELKGK